MFSLRPLLRCRHWQRCCQQGVNVTEENADRALSELPLEPTCSCIFLEDDEGDRGRTFAQVLSRVSRESFIFMSLSDNNYFLNRHAHSVCFHQEIICFFKFITFTSFHPNGFFSAMVPALLLFVLAHLVVISPFCSSMSLPIPLLPLLFASPSILPSYPLATWAGAMQVARAKVTCGTGQEVGDRGFGPSGKDNKSCSCLMSASSHRSVPQILHTFSQNISLNHSFFPFLFLSPQPLMKYFLT